MAQQITPTEAQELCDNYDNKYKALTKLIKKDDNRSCSLSIKELESYLKYIKEANKNIDGVRIYLGSNNKGLTTMFIAPTVNDKDDKSLNVLNRFNNGVPPKKKYIK